MGKRKELTQKKLMTGKEIKNELEKNYGWNFSSEENMEMYYELFSDVQKLVLFQPIVSGSVCDVCNSSQDIQIYCEKCMKERC